MKLSAKDRRALILGAVGLGVILLVHLTVVPLWDSWSIAREEKSTNRVQLDDLNRKLRRVLGQRQRLVRMYGPAVKQPLTDLQTAKSNLFQAAQDVLKSSGIKMTDYQPQRERLLRDIPGVGLVALQVRGDCQLPQLAKCLSQMSDAKSLVIVERITVTNNEKQPGKLKVVMVLATLAEINKSES